MISNCMYSSTPSFLSQYFILTIFPFIYSLIDFHCYIVFCLMNITYHNLFIHSFFDEYLSYFQFFSLKNCASVKSLINDVPVQ